MLAPSSSSLQNTSKGSGLALISCIRLQLSATSNYAGPCMGRNHEIRHACQARRWHARPCLKMHAPSGCTSRRNQGRLHTSCKRGRQCIEEVPVRSLNTCQRACIAHQRYCLSWSLGQRLLRSSNALCMQEVNDMHCISKNKRLCFE